MKRLIKIVALVAVAAALATFLSQRIARSRGRLRGLLYRLFGRRPDPDIDDLTLADRVLRRPMGRAQSPFVALSEVWLSNTSCDRLPWRLRQRFTLLLDQRPHVLDLLTKGNAVDPTQHLSPQHAQLRLTRRRPVGGRHQPVKLLQQIVGNRAAHLHQRVVGQTLEPGTRRAVELTVVQLVNKSTRHSVHPCQLPCIRRLTDRAHRHKRIV